MHVGAAEESDADANVGFLIARETDNLGELIVELEAFDADVIADGEATAESDIVLTLTDHSLQEVDLAITDDGEGLQALLVATPGGIHHEGIDVGKDADAIELGTEDLHEDHAVDEHLLYLLAPPIAPVMDFPTGGTVCLEACIGQILIDFFFGTGSNISDIPTALIFRIFHTELFDFG